MTESSFSIRRAEFLTKSAYDIISRLQNECALCDKTALKLELDYKLAYANAEAGKRGNAKTNEFLCFLGEELIGYLGIGDFGGVGMPLEVNGMVHPCYRRRGVFTRLHEAAMEEYRRRNFAVLLLCDRESHSGQAFIKKTPCVYKESEFEMYLRRDFSEPTENENIVLRKAVNADAYEIIRQDALFYGEDIPANAEETGTPGILPEEEEARGMTIYFAEKDGITIGKVHVQVDSTGIGGIYGLGVLPEHRGKGYGRAVLNCAVRKLKEANAREIMLQVATQNDTALNLYRSCGFEVTSTMDYFELLL